MDLTDRVRAALEAAKENGYDMSGLAPLEVAVDLLTYDGELEHEDICEVCDAVVIVRLELPPCGGGE